MRFRSFRMVCIFSVLPAFLALISLLRADDGAKSRFEIEYPAAVKLLLDRFDNCQGKFRLEWDENGTRMGMDVDFFRSHGFDKVEIRTSGMVGGKKFRTSEVHCVDETTAFQVHKLEDQPKWNLNKVSYSPLERDAFDVQYGRIIRAPLGGIGKSIAAMMDEGTIEIEDAQVVAERPNEIEVTFRVEDETPLERIVATFDTANHWALTRQICFAGTPTRTTTDYRVEYAATATDGIRLPLRVRVEQHNSPYEFRQWKFGEVPREQFLLTSYGLPDVISGRNRNRFGWFEWLMLAAIAVAIGLGIVFLRLSKGRDRVPIQGA